MRLAINYSPPAERLLRAGEIEVDLFKCPDWAALVNRLRVDFPVYVHFALYAGRGLRDELDDRLIRAWLRETETLVVNTHFVVLQSDFVPDARITPEMVIERALRDLRRLGERFGMENIVLENVPYPTRGWIGELLPAVADPAVISEVVRRSGCGFLLDIAHALHACEALGDGDARAYIEALPVHALRELHVVGLAPAADECGLRHEHSPMRQPDWEITTWALDQIRRGLWHKPETLAFEYGGVGERFAGRSEPAVIAEQWNRLHKLART